MAENWQHFWHEDWARSRERFAAWWRRDGLIFDVIAPLDQPRLPGEPVEHNYLTAAGIDPYGTIEAVSDLPTAWTESERRARIVEKALASTYFGGDAVPFFDTHIGPGSLAIMLGSEPNFAQSTVWYEPCFTNGDVSIQFDSQNPWYIKQKMVLEAGVAIRQGRFLVGMPDLVENLDTLAALRGTEPVLFDLIEEPDRVCQQLATINQAFFAIFERFYEIIKDPWGGNAFSAFRIWGPGKTAKIQCDANAMISPRMFTRFVEPYLTEQCEWLDYSMFHLDGTQAMCHLDRLLAIDALDAIEWTPQTGKPSGGDPIWYDLYRRILSAGKSVQAVGVKPDEVIPLLDAIGTHGVYIMTRTETEAEARELARKVDTYR